MSDPAEALALAQAAGACAKQGDAAGALDAATRALAIDPDCALAHVHVAVAHLQRDDPAAALPAIERSLALAPDDVTAHEVHGAALAGAGRYGPARAAFVRAAQLAPARAEPWFNAGAIAMSAGDPAGAVAAHAAALKRDPRFRPALHGLATALHALDRLAEAGAVWARIAALDPADAGARHLAAALGGANPAAPPSGYVAETFDAYAARFDRHLVEHLRYDGPALLRDAVAPFAPFARALDLGCGTGLAGAALRPLCDRLDGVDLSPRMLEVAAARGLYDALATADVVEYLRTGGDRYQLVVAADVLGYVGDLAPCFAALPPRLAPGGHVAFTIERGDGLPDGFRLQPTGRYRHDPAYVARLAAAAGLAVVSCREAPLRDDAEGPVIGLVYVLAAV